MSTAVLRLLQPRSLSFYYGCSRAPSPPNPPSSCTSRALPQHPRGSPSFICCFSPMLPHCCHRLAVNRGPWCGLGLAPSCTPVLKPPPTSSRRLESESPPSPPWAPHPGLGRRPRTPAPPPLPSLPPPRPCRSCSSRCQGNHSWRGGRAGGRPSPTPSPSSAPARRGGLGQSPGKAGCGGRGAPRRSARSSCSPRWLLPPKEAHTHTHTPTSPS